MKHYIEKMNLNEILNWRYSTKQFNENKKLTDEQITKLIELTNLSASSYGLQPFKMVIVSNEEIKKDLVASSYGQTNIANSSHLIIFALRTDINETFINNYIENISKKRNIESKSLQDFKNMLINSVTKKEKNDLYKWASDQIYIALGTFLIACASEKIDACPIGGFIPNEYDEKLELSKYNLKSVVVAAIGYRSEEDKYQFKEKVRAHLDEMIIKL